MLDYISPNSAVTLWNSIRAQHYPVVVAIIGSMSIIFITIVSTGLIVLQPTLVVRKDMPVFLDSRLEDTSFNSGLVDGLPLMAASAILSGNFSITYPSNTNQQYAVEQFRIIENFTGECDVNYI